MRIYITATSTTENNTSVRTDDIGNFDINADMSSHTASDEDMFDYLR